MGFFIVCIVLIGAGRVNRSVAPRRVRNFRSGLERSFNRAVEMHIRGPLAPRRHRTLVGRVECAEGSFGTSVRVVRPVPVSFSFRMLPFRRRVRGPVRTPRGTDSSTDDATSSGGSRDG